MKRRVRGAGLACRVFTAAAVLSAVLAVNAAAQNLPQKIVHPPIQRAPIQHPQAQTQRMQYGRVVETQPIAGRRLSPPPHQPPDGLYMGMMAPLGYKDYDWRTKGVGIYGQDWRGGKRLLKSAGEPPLPYYFYSGSESGTPY